jgi:DNA-binding IclR family transcriptional regulator
MSALNQIVDDKILRILTVLYHNKEKFYHLTQLAKESNVPAATTLRLLSRLADSGLLLVAYVGKLKIYKFSDTENNNKIMELLSI